VDILTDEVKEFQLKLEAIPKEFLDESREVLRSMIT
jgi:hypothetical protein